MRRHITIAHGTEIFRGRFWQQYAWLPGSNQFLRFCFTDKFMNNTDDHNQPWGIMTHKIMKNIFIYSLHM